METCKNSLTADPDLQSSVDWLTEVIHRFTDAYVKGNAPSTVNMDVLMHVEKVSVLDQFFLQFGSPTCLQWKKYESRYTDRAWTPQEMAAFEDGILIHGAELRAVRDEIGSRAMPEVVRYYGHWKKCVCLPAFIVPHLNYFT